MIFDPDSPKPIYMQLADWLEIEILNGRFATDEKVYSQYQLAEMFDINPATAAKGLNRLVEEGILYKKRGLGMFVTEEAKEKIWRKRKTETLKRLMIELVVEAKRLDVKIEQLLEMVRDVYEREVKS